MATNDIYCPDGIDCPLFGTCKIRDDYTTLDVDEGDYMDLCPLMDRDGDRTKPLDKLFEEGF
jgi:hypothetical protein